MKHMNYQEIKNDIWEIVNETMQAGNTQSGGFGRAINEYWLDQQTLYSNKPLPYTIKLVAMLAIMDRKQHAGESFLAQDWSTLDWLLDHVEKTQILEEINPECLELCLADAARFLSERRLEGLRLILA